MTAQELRAWALRLDLTQAEAALLLRVPFETYRKWETGRAACAAPGLLEIATERLERDLLRHGL